MGMKVVEELGVEPAREGLRVGTPAMVVRFGERAPGRGRDVLRAGDLCPRAPEGADPLVASLALAPSGRCRRSPGAAGGDGTCTRRCPSALRGGPRVACATGPGAPATRLGVDGRQRLVPEHVADDRGVLQRGALGSRRVRPDGPAARRSAWSARGHRAACRAARASARLDLDHAVVDQHLHQLFHVERVAFRSAGDHGAQALPGCRPGAAAAPRRAPG